MKSSSKSSQLRPRVPYSSLLCCIRMCANSGKKMSAITWNSAADGIWCFFVSVVLRVRPVSGFLDLLLITNAKIHAQWIYPSQVFLQYGRKKIHLLVAQLHFVVQTHRVLDTCFFVFSNTFLTNIVYIRQTSTINNAHEFHMFKPKLICMFLVSLPALNFCT